jgi:NADPH:quinone reductase-like Zn-dependent oxidoreductase
MRAVVATSADGQNRIQVVDAPTPTPGPHEVLVRVSAAALHPTDMMAAGGMYVQFGAAVAAEQAGIGVDAVGVVEAVGKAVTTVEVGQTLIGAQERLDVATAAQAEYVALEKWAVAPAPKDVPLTEAAGLPLNGLTRCRPSGRWPSRRPDGWLVTGAAGAVGRLAVQLAVLQGLRVLAHARPGDEKELRALGAAAFVSSEDPLGPSVRALVPGGVTGVVDSANLGVAAMDAVAHGGRYVNLLNSAPLARRGIEAINVAYHTDRAQLGLLSGLAAGGAISVAVAETFPLDDAVCAHERLTAGGLRGLLVLTP